MQAMVLSLCFLLINTIISASGNLDSSFNSSGYVLTTIGDSAQGYATAIQPDGKIVVVGSAISGETTVGIVARYTIEGVLDTTFANPNGSATIDIPGAASLTAYCVQVQADGKIVVAGTVNVYSEDFTFVARYLSNGLLDTVANNGTGFGPAMEGTGPGYVLGSFPGGGSQIFYGMAIQQNDQKIVVTGQSGNNLVLARYTTAGILDSSTDLGNVPFVDGYGYVTFNPLSSTLGRGVVIDAQGNIVVCGQVVNGHGYLFIARYLTTGAIDGTFGYSGWNSQNPGPNSDGDFIGYGIAFQSDEKIVVSGADDVNALVVRFSADGILDTSFGLGSQYCFFTRFGTNTVAGAYGICVDKDDYIIFDGACYNSTLGLQAAIAKIIPDGSQLDTQFGSSSGYTTFQVTSGVNSPTLGFFIQPNGRFVLTGYNNYEASNNELMVLRFLGIQPQGCMDVDYNPQLHSQNAPGFAIDPTQPTGTLAPTSLPNITAIYPGQSGNLFVAATSTVLSALTANLVQLDASGSIVTNSITANFSLVYDVIMNASEQVVLVGANPIGTSGMLQSFDVQTGTPTTPGNFISGAQVPVFLATSLVRVGQQTNGRYVTIGQSSDTTTNGIVIGYTKDFVLDDYTQPHPFGYNFEGGISGYNILADANFTDLLIDSNNGIYIAYQNNASVGTGAGDICIAKFLPDGSDFDTSFYNDGILDTGLTVDSCGLPYITFDANQSRLILAAAEHSTGNIFVSSWDIQGYLPQTGGVIYQTTSFLSTPVITKLQCDTNNNVLLSGYDNYDMFVTKFPATMVTTVDLDTTFAPYGICPGILRTTYNDNNPTNATGLTVPYRYSNTMCITTLGNIMFGGYEEITSTQTVSMIGQVVGDTTTPATQVARFPGELFPGTINPYFGTDGTLQVPGSLTIHPEAMDILTSGSLSGNILIGVTNPSESEIAGLQSNFSLNTTNFGIDLEGSTSGITPTLPAALVNIRQIITDHAGCIYVVGDDAITTTVLTKLSADGSTIIWSYQNDAMKYGLCVAEQASGRIVIGGYDATTDIASGVIVGIDPNTGLVDSSFNQGTYTPGYYYSGLYISVTSLSIVDVSDQILFSHAYYSDGTVHVYRLLENGALDVTFPTGEPTVMTNLVDWTQIKMQQDVNGKIVVATVVGGSGISTGFALSRYNADGSDDVVNVSIPVAGYVGSSVSLKNILCLSDGTTLVVGFNSAGNKVVLAKLTAEFALDSSFATGGIMQTPVTTYNSTTLTSCYALGMSSVAPYDIIISGDDGVNPYLVGIVSGLDAAVTAVSQSTRSWGLPGTLDTTYNFDSGEEPGFLDLTNEIITNLGSPGTTKALVCNPVDGSYFVVADDGVIDPSDGTNSYVIKFGADDVQDVTFGINGVVTIADMKQVNCLFIAQDGNLLVGGSGASIYGMLASLNASTGDLNFLTTADSFYYNFVIAQQTNGRIIVAGADYNGQPGLMAYNSVDGAIDITFADNGLYSFTDYGYFIPSIVIDQADNIYFMVNNPNVYPQLAYTKKLSSDGTQILWTADSTMSSSNGIWNRLAIDQQGDIIAATVQAISGDTIIINRYSSLDGSTLQGPLSLSSGITGIGRPNINGLLVDATTPTGNIIVVGCDSGYAPNYVPFVARVLSDLSGLDTTFNQDGSYPGVQSIAVSNPSSGVGVWYTGFIEANGKITVGGYALINGNTKKPYLMRLYGNDFIQQFFPASLTAGTQGTINTNFAQDGALSFTNVSGALGGLTAQVVLPLPNGYQYVAFTSGDLIRITNGNELDPTFGSNGFAQAAPPGVTAMIMDSNGCLVLAGTNGSYGWIARYANDDTGFYDPTFNDGFAVDIGSNTQAVCVIEQTLSRLVVAGQDLNSANATLWAFTNLGAVDTTFNANGTPGYYSDDTSHLAAALIADEYDRLIFAHYVMPTLMYRTYDNNVTLTRLTASGELDLTFGDGAEYPYSGSLTNAIIDADDEVQIRLVFDINGNIVVAAHTLSGIAVAAYENGTGAVVATDALTIYELVSPELTNLIATADGKILLSGNQISNDATENLMWIARVYDRGYMVYELDATFAPDPAAVPGILQFTAIDDVAVIARNCSSIAIYGDGEISILAFVNDGGFGSSYMLRAYDVPYTTQEQICQYALPIGTNDQTFGVTENIGNGIVFLATGQLVRSAPLNQYAQALALQDDQNIVVACNGQTTYEGQNNIIIDMFDVDGLLNPNFNPDAQAPCVPGQVIVLDSFDNQYVQDMMTFSVGDVHKAILAGYVNNSTLNSSNSLLMQYVLAPDAPGLDSSFGGYSGDPLGIALGNGSAQGYTVGRQTMGRIIVGGVSMINYYDQAGLLQAYTSSGLLDQSFGTDGYFTLGQTGIYTSAIDSMDRILIAYNDYDNGYLNIARILPDGSGLDTSFNSGGGYPGIYQVVYEGAFDSWTNLKLAVDQDDNVYAFVGLNSGTSLGFTALTPVGDIIAQTEYNGSIFGGLTNFTITKLLTTQNVDFDDNKYLVLVGYDQTQVEPEQDILMVASFVNVGGTWYLNSSAFNSQDTPGYIKYTLDSFQAQKSAGAIIHPDGRVIVAGSVTEIIG